MPEYTAEQQMAISSVESSTVVIAGAGSGKTRVLVGRYLELLTRRLADISEIVAITFTNKAAAEMNERIRKALEDELEIANEFDKKYFESLLARQSESVICTIDSLCKKIISEYPLEAGVSPSFEVMDNLEVSRRMKAAARSAVEMSLEACDELTRFFIERSSYKILVEGLVESYKKIRITGVDMEKLAASDVEEIIFAPYFEDDKMTLPHHIAANHVLKLVESMHKFYESLGGNGSRLDFVELEKVLLKLLRDEKTGSLIRNGIKYVMVDEYQDINDIQDEIIRLLVKDDYAKKLFVVGDPKQSIYRFRGGNLKLFNEMAEEISSFSDNGLINLDINFRSQASLIEVTNHMFSKMFDSGFIPAKSASKIGYEEPSCELVLINSRKNAEKTAEIEARYIAENIQKLVKSQGIPYNDIAVLMRKKTNMNLFARILEEYDIPCEIENSSGLYSAPEIALLLNLLISITDESDDLTLTAVLRSILFNLDDSDLMNIRLSSRDASLYTAFINYDDSVKKSEKIAWAQYVLAKLSADIEITDPFSIIMKAIDETDMEAKLALYPDGEKRLSNLRKFLEIAMNMARKYCIYDLVDCFRELAEEDDSEAEVSLSSNAVSIMSVHKSKGLEFPMVFLPQISRPMPVFKDFGLFDKDLGFWARVKKELLDYDDFAKQIKLEDEGKELAEEIRCLYVALTRARDKVILVGTEDLKIASESSTAEGSSKGKTGEFKKASWLNLISNALDMTFARLGESIYEIGEHSGITVRVFDEDDFLGQKNGISEKVQEKLNVPIDKFPLLKPIISNENRKITLPVSGLATYSQCVRRYVYRHVLKIQPDFLPNLFSKQFVAKKGLSAVEVGDAFHAICRRLENVENVDEVIKEEVFKINSSYLKSDIENLRPMVNKFIEHYLCEASYAQVFREEPFLLKIHNLTVSGVIDRLQINGCDAIITDFKTDRVDKNYLEERALDYQLQMECYALAVASKFKCHEIKTRLHFMRIDEIYERKYSQDDISSIRERLFDSIEGIDGITLEKAPCEHKPFCPKCVYASLCGFISF